MTPKSTTFDHVKIDKKWQSVWKQHRTYEVSENSLKKKFYILDMFPYPSGSGLHIGHILGYTCTDVLSRMKRLEGYNVLHPMGWDSFGLPAEQYAMKHNKHPRDITLENVTRFKSQLESIGFSYDWSREICTSEPSYYKWTQFIFSEMFKRGLAYQGEHSVNYCPALGTVLSKEEVGTNSKSKDGGHAVIKEKRNQWVLKITDYADRLLDDLDVLDWPEGIKEQQRNWIGKLSGFNVKCNWNNIEFSAFCSNIRNIENACCIILHPEHNLVHNNGKEGRSRLYKMDVTASCLLVPRKLSVIVSDYASEKFGTCSYIVCDDSDDDIAFLKDNGIEFNDYEDRHILCNYKIEDAQAKNIIIEKTIYRLRDWVFARQRFWGEPLPIYYYQDGGKRSLDIDELPLELPRDTPYRKSVNSTKSTPLSKDVLWMNSIDTKSGNSVTKDPNTMPQWAGSCWYYLRFMDPKNDCMLVSPGAEKYWKQVDLYVGGAEHAILHLLYARFWHKFLYDIGIVTSKEPFLSLRNQGLIYANAYVDETRKFYPKSEVEKRGNKFSVKGTNTLVSEVFEKMSKSKMNGVSPDSLLETYGADAVRMYVLFMGPFEQSKKFDSQAIVGCKRFLNRVFQVLAVVTISSESRNKKIAIYIQKIKQLILDMKFNVAISEAMILFNNKLFERVCNTKDLKDFISLFSTIAPHICNELWEIHNFDSDINVHKISNDFVNDPIEKESVQYKVCINGKFIKNTPFSNDMYKEDLIKEVYAIPQIHEKLKGRVVSNIIFVKNKLINIVIDK